MQIIYCIVYLKNQFKNIRPLLTLKTRYRILLTNFETCFIFILYEIFSIWHLFHITREINQIYVKKSYVGKKKSKFSF